MALNLEPNELVGYRIKPDWNSYNVVLVKRKGPASKNAGQEYDTPLAYCKNLEFAAAWIFSHAARMQGELNQKDQAKANGSVAEAAALAKAFSFAQESTLQAVEDLRAQIAALPLNRKELVQALGTQA